jgi:tRNA threonylcarbamoyl adenosine modification protein (Sua5/YciO/YrdC/YwlC family)
MTRVFEVDSHDPDAGADSVRAAADALLEGSLVVIPTETLYGIACRPDLAAATARLFAAKRRPADLNLPVLADTTAAVLALGLPDDRAVRLAAAFWPGPLTLVVPRSPRSERWELGARRGSIALRVPDLPLTTSLLAATGPLAVTSANLSGLPPLADRNGLVATFGEAVAVYLVMGPDHAAPAGTASTVVDLTEDAFRIRRLGPISEERIRAVAGR